MKIIDAHVHLGVSSHRESNSTEVPFDWYNGATGFVQAMDEAGVECAVVIPTPHRDFHIGRSNDYVFNAYQKYPNRLIPFCRIDEKLEENLKRGFKGAKLHLVYEVDEHFKIKDIAPTLKILEDWHAPLLLHAKFNAKVEQVKEILNIAPNLFLILAHCGRGHISTAEQVIENANALKKFDRVYFETSTVEDPQVRNGQVFTDLCRIIGSHRVLFGTDFPFYKEHGYDACVRWGKNYPLNTNTLQMVMFENVFNLLNLENEERVIIRRTNSKDIPLLFDVFFNELSQQDQKYLAIHAKLKYRTYWERSVSSGNSCFLAILQNRVVGYMRVFPMMKNTNKGDLWEIVIHPDYRKRGIAGHMMKYLHRRFSEMFAKTDAKNIPMQTLLQSFGYVPENPDAARIIKWNKK